MVGMFSQKGAEYGGTFRWRDTEGKLVEVVSVYRTVEEAERMFLWDDRQVVSTTLVEFAGRVKEGICNKFEKIPEKALDTPPVFCRIVP